MTPFCFPCLPYLHHCREYSFSSHRRSGLTPPPSTSCIVHVSTDVHYPPITFPRSTSVFMFSAPSSSFTSLIFHPPLLSFPSSLLFLSLFHLLQSIPDHSLLSGMTYDYIFSHLPSIYIQIFLLWFTFFPALVLFPFLSLPQYSCHSQTMLIFQLSYYGVPLLEYTKYQLLLPQTWPLSAYFCESQVICLSLPNFGFRFLIIILLMSSFCICFCYHYFLAELQQYSLHGMNNIPSLTKSYEFTHLCHITVPDHASLENFSLTLQFYLNLTKMSYQVQATLVTRHGQGN